MGGLGVLQEQPVEGVGELGVGREQDRLARGADDLEPRMLPQREAPGQRRGGEPARGHRDERVPVEAEERGGVVGDDAAQRLQQPAVPIAGAGRLPGIIDLAAKVERVHAEKPTCPHGLAAHLAEVLAGMESHMAKEEHSSRSSAPAAGPWPSCPSR